MALSKFIRTVLLAVIALIAIFILPSCQNKQKESVEVHTTLTVTGKGDNISGVRTIEMIFPTSVIAPGSEAASNLETVIKNHKPDSLTYTRKDDGRIHCIFSLVFDSKKKYQDTVDSLMGESSTITLSHPDSTMTKGWQIHEDFQSSDLVMGWITDGARKEGFKDFDFTTNETSTSVSFDQVSQQTGPSISVNTLSGYPIQKIRIETQRNKDKANFDRKVIFYLDTATYDQAPEEITNYFKTVSAAEPSWPLSEDKSVYMVTVELLRKDQTNLSNATAKLLYTNDSKLEYKNQEKGSTVLAEQNSLEEILDFSNYIGNEGQPVPIEYVYNVEDTNDLSDCQVYKDSEWSIVNETLDENNPRKLCAVKFNESTIKLRINDGVQYKAESIEIESIPQENDMIQKTITFWFPEGDINGRAAQHAQTYLDEHGYGAIKEFVGNRWYCRFQTTSSAEALNEAFSNILSGKNTIHITNEAQFMQLRTMKHYSERMDLSSLLVGENIDTPVYYHLKNRSGDIIKKFTYHSPDGSAESDLNKNGGDDLSLTLSGTDIHIDFDITTPNISDIVFCSVISSILVIIALAMILMLRNKKLPFASLGGGENTTGLPGGNNKLAVRKKNGLKKK